MQVLDLKGLSGTVYRFRHVSNPSDLPVQAGAFVMARIGPSDAADVRACGTRRSLVELAKLWSELTTGGARMFVRLNVSRAARLAEHDDLVGLLKPGDVLTERD
jgi:hypothetical protein